jgi:hypothetical protein
MNFSDMRDRLQWLRGDDGVTSERQVLDVLGGILQPLLAAEGLNLVVPTKPESVPLDFAAKSLDRQDAPLSVAIEYKHSGRERLSAAFVHQWLRKSSALLLA